MPFVAPATWTNRRRRVSGSLQVRARHATGRPSPSSGTNGRRATKSVGQRAIRGRRDGPRPDVVGEQPLPAFHVAGEARTRAPAGRRRRSPIVLRIASGRQQRGEVARVERPAGRRRGRPSRGPSSPGRAGGRRSAARRTRTARAGRGTPGPATTRRPWPGTGAPSPARRPRTLPAPAAGRGPDRRGRELGRDEAPVEALAGERVEEARRVADEEPARAGPPGHPVAERPGAGDRVAAARRAATRPASSLGRRDRRPRSRPRPPAPPRRRRSARHVRPSTIPTFTRPPATGAIPT